jgi:hypothetical protein
VTPPTPPSRALVDRRTFLKIGSIGVSALAGAPARIDAEAQAPPGPLVDVNTYISRYPFRRLPGDETPDLVKKLRERGVTRAWAGSFDALLHRDIAGVNARLADECRAHGDGLLVPFGTVNPKQPDWEDDLRRCHEDHHMPGLRLHPNYHGYKLDDPDFVRLLELAAGRRLVVQIASTMEDERTQHPLLQVPHVDAAPLVEHARRLPGLRLVLLNAFRALSVAKLGGLAEVGNISFDIATLELVGGVSVLIDKVPAERVLFGSYYPYFYFESAALKLQESPLNSAQLRAIASDNAKTFLNIR